MVIMSLIDVIGIYIFYYPLVMSIVWISGGLFYCIRREMKKQPEYPELKECPLVSILIPARNEEASIRDTVEHVLQSKYENIEIIVINDASTDNTQQILENMSEQYSQLRIIHMQENMGKANGLNYAFLMSKGEIILTIDADCLLDERAIHWMVLHFITSPRVGAVTGNPRVRNRTSLLAKIQAAEYSSVIGLIKRTQRILGKVLTVSGVIAAFRRQALIDVGLWSNNMITDDIDMTWKLEKRFWDIRYETNALCWILVPERMIGLWRQRVRWAQGGVEVMRKHWDIWKSWKQRRIWLVYLDYLCSIVWAYLLLICMSLWVASIVFDFSSELAAYGNLIAKWNGAFIAFVCLLQFLVSIAIDRRYDKSLWLVYGAVIWYPVIYWFFHACAIVYATPKALTRNLDTMATWISPDRGLQAESKKGLSI